VETPSVLIAGAAASQEGELRAALRDLVRVTDVVRTSAEAPRAYQELRPAAVLLGVGDASVDAVLAATTSIAAQGGRVGVIGCEMDAELILRVMRAGAREFVVDGDKSDLRRAVRALVASPSGGLGSVVTMFPAKGGVGATTLATNLAGVICRAERRVCLLDLDRFFGDVLSFLDLAPKYAIGEVIANMRRLDRDLLDSSVATHTSGLAVLAHAEKIEEAERVRASDIEQLLGFLRQHYDWIVIDGLHGLDDTALAALDASDRILVVLTPDVPAVRNAQRALELLRGVGHADGKIRLVLNRAQRHGKVTPEVVAESVGLPVAGSVSADFATVIHAINRGAVLVDEAPSSRVAKEVRALATLVTGAVAGPKRRSLLARWLGKAVAHGAQ